MTYLELAGLVGVAVSVMGVWLTIYALINNRTLKAEARRVGELLEKESEDTKKILEKIAEMINRTNDLIVSEGSKTRSLIKTTS